MKENNCYNCRFANIDIDEIKCNKNTMAVIVHYPERECSEYKESEENINE